MRRIENFIFIAAWLACAVVTVRADDTVSLSLLRPDSLSGWEYGPAPHARWTMSDGKLTGSRGATPLLSGWTFGDFELTFRWSTGAKGTLALDLPEAPQGEGLRIIFKEGAGGGAIRERGRELSQGQDIKASTDGWHTATVSRNTSVLIVKIDDQQAGLTSLAPDRRFGLGLAVLDGDVSLADMRILEPPGKSLFNGTDLSGWRKYGAVGPWLTDYEGHWTVEDGQLVCTGKSAHFLGTDKEYGNFTFSLDYKMQPGCNSGIAIRTPYNGWPSNDGYEVQLIDAPGPDKNSTMSIYGHFEPFDRGGGTDTWNHAVVKTDGRMISGWINGQLMQQADTSRSPELQHRLLRGWIGLQDHGGKIAYRNIRLLEAPDGPGLDAWFAPRSEPGSTIVLDRLINNERLSQIDGLGSGVVTRTIDKPGVQVLADLKGPGALVRLWTSAPGGPESKATVALYFDGQSEPTIEAPFNELFGKLPPIGDNQEPLLTCAAYATSLKIKVRDAEPGTWRLDYVTFPPKVPVTSFTKVADLPRGLLNAIDYQCLHFNFATHRDIDDYLKLTSDPRSIDPGQRRVLISSDGAGIVRWMKLMADQSVLANDDLWLEITIDGERSPAIAAPARYLFPQLADGVGHRNLVATNRKGPTSFLAMPFSGGFTLAAVNRGHEPLRDIGAVMSIDVAGDRDRQSVAHRMRLRGIFQPAGSGPPGAADHRVASNPQDLIRQSGTGRWVAFVYRLPADGKTGISSLQSNGQPRDGWKADNLNALFGRPPGAREFKSTLSGQSGDLAWRYFLLAPVSFERSLVLRARDGDKLGDRLALFYLQK